MTTVLWPSHPAGLAPASPPAPPHSGLARDAGLVSAGQVLLASYREAASRATSVREQQNWTRQAQSFHRLLDSAPMMSREELSAAELWVSSERARIRDHIDRQLAQGML